MRRVINYVLIVVIILICNPIYSQSPERLRKDALAFHIQALREQKLGHDSIAYSLHYDIASIYGHTKEYDNAIIHSEIARSLAEKLYGKQSEEYALSTQNTGTYLYAKGDTLKALSYLKQAYYNPKGNKQLCAGNLAGIYSALNEADSCYKYTKEAWQLFTTDFVHTLSIMSTEKRFDYACQMINYSQSILPIFYYLQNEEHTGFKQLALDCMLFNKNIIIDCEGDDNELKNVSDVNFDSIKTYLGENDIAIEFWSDKGSLITWEDDIIVSIIRRSYEVPIFVKLSKEKIYNTLNNRYEASVNYLPLYENIWKEIIEKAHIKEGERLFVALDDILNQIPIESICNYDWDYMGDKYEIVRVSNTSLIPRITQEIEVGSAVLYGGLVYNEKSLSQGDNQNSGNRSLIHDNMYSEIGDTIVSEIRTGAKYLPWTKTETDSIQKILSNSNVTKVLVLQREDGTEESFKLLSGNSPSIIHVSTHGFFIQPKEAMSWADYYNYCMVHSGLLMSGVLVTNEINADSIIVDDGFLRSSEIAALDLTNTQLVVLSACKTGFGGETPWSIAGLQKAFKAAGVKTILLTLDNVDDAATCLMMTSFYKFLLSGNSKRKALRKAQQILRDSDSFNPFVYWGNFVLID